jgi:hypothetical protein
MIHLDLLTGPIPSLMEGYRYLLVIVDDYTRFAWVFGLKDKSIISNWRKWRSMIEIQYGNKYGDVRNRKYSLRLKFIRADNGGEFISNEIDAIWSSEGISPQLTVAHEHNQAGVVERTIQTVVSHAISILEDACLPLNLWYEVCRTVIYLMNRWPKRYLKGITPYEAIEQRIPDLSLLRVIGSKCWVLIPKSNRDHKFDSRAAICRLLGYEATNQYILWDPDMNKVIYARSVQIDEYNTIFKTSECTEIDEIEDDHDFARFIADDRRNFDTDGDPTVQIPNQAQNEAPNQAQNEAPNQAQNEAQNQAPNDLQDEIGQLIDETIGIDDGGRHRERDESDDDYHHNHEMKSHEMRREPYPKRTRLPSSKMRENQAEILLYATNVIANMPKEPISRSEALKRPDSHRWIEAMDKQLKVLEENDTWETIDRVKVPRQAEIIKGKWVYVIKRDGTYKARYVVRGDLQRQGWDY